ncbi:MAG: CCA tRNA nucleotidyltransferase [Paracoccaceae bacterium]
MRIPGGFPGDPGLGRVLAMLDSGGHRALIVGGAVRNAVLGQPIGDIDIATDARPERVVELAAAAGLKSIPTGIEHGTVTVVSGGIPFEITTFRRDVETDGRNATVAFSDRIEEDAARRDFTMNALYATASGEVLDPVGGWPDLRRRVLRFVGDPTARIREDYLRILRFFRFLAWYARSSAPGTIEAISAEKSGLPRVSAERIGAEMRKLLAAPDPSPAMALMAETGVLAMILPDADAADLAALVAAERASEAAPDWRRRLSLILPEGAAKPLRLSRSEATHLDALSKASTLSPAEAGFRYGVELGRDAALIRLARGEDLPADWSMQVRKGAESPLPVAAADLMPDLEGPALGRGLKAAEALWIGSGFSASRDALIAAAKDAGGPTG